MNFDYFKKYAKFSVFVSEAVKAERLFAVDYAMSVFECRKAMEIAVKWLYSVEKSLNTPYQTDLNSLLSAGDFRRLAGDEMVRRLHLIRYYGNTAAHTKEVIHQDRAVECLKNLFLLLDFIACCYVRPYKSQDFNPNLLPKPGSLLAPPPAASVSHTEIDFEKLLKENAKLREKLSNISAQNRAAYVEKPLNLSEYKTRKIYIDAMLLDAGWAEGENWVNEMKLDGMPTPSGTGSADYVLFGADGLPLAVVEAKKTSVNLEKGRRQAELYADALERDYKRRPVIFLTNGFKTRIKDGQYPERETAAVYSPRDLEKLFNLRASRQNLRGVTVNPQIAGRYYQEGAIKAVCETLDQKNRRKALLVMATGSGKTRTVIGLCDILLQREWIKNVLFLADRTELVGQAKKSFVTHLPSFSVSNLCDREKRDYNARGIFCTYQTMMNCIDTITDEQGKIFSVGHFDLIVCDEAHRSIYNKYRGIFHYFDAPLLGLTATPKDEIDKNTYEIFDLHSGDPTYGYDLKQAIDDGCLVPYRYVEAALKFIENGIVYNELSETEKEDYEKTFRDQDGNLPESINSSALNNWVFNDDTIRKALDLLMTKGLRVDYGQKIGKTIIFAQNHKHTEKIREVFEREYPHLAGSAEVIDNYINYADTLIKAFKKSDSNPQIAISVDMLDTGIDVPEILNLVFFKKVYSKAKIWQMIGRGTRLCPKLLDGADKKEFYIFDFCGNFEFFSLGKDRAAPQTTPLQGRLFKIKAEILCKLRGLAYQTPEIAPFRDRLVQELTAKVKELHRDNFAVKQHLQAVLTYSDPERFQCLTELDLDEIERELVPLIYPDAGDPKALRFDALLYDIELAQLAAKPLDRFVRDLRRQAKNISEVGNIREIQAQAPLLRKILDTDYLDHAQLDDWEQIRLALRELLANVDTKKARYETSFTDEIINVDWKDMTLEDNYLQTYKEKVRAYFNAHANNRVLAKLQNNIPLTSEDRQKLERILWEEIGSQEDYERENSKENSKKTLGEFVREIIGLDRAAARKAFEEFLDANNFNSRQIDFVNHIIDYIVQNGMMKDLAVMMESPFNEHGSFAELFDDSAWERLQSVIQRVNANAG